MDASSATVRIQTTVLTGTDKKTSYSPAKHCWRETFSFDQSGLISRLDVYMNLDRSCEEAEDALGLSPLMRASANGELAVLHSLKAKGVRLNLTNHEGASALYYAAQNVEKGDQVLAFFEKNLSPSEFERLLKIQAKPNGHTVAFEATFNINEKVVSYLLGLEQAGIRVNFHSPSVFGWTPKTFAERESMSFAASLPKGEVRLEDRTKWLLGQEKQWLDGLKGSERSFHEQGMKLINAVAAHNIPEVERLVKEGVNVNARYGRLLATPLNSASMPGLDNAGQIAAKQTVLALLQLGADPNFSEGGIMKVPHGFREAVFGYAAILEDTIAFLKAQKSESLLDHYLNIQGPMNGYTKLIDAALRGRKEVIDVLLKHGARIDTKGHNGMTAFDAAILYNKNSASPLSSETLDLLKFGKR